MTRESARLAGRGPLGEPQTRPRKGGGAMNPEKTSERRTRGAARSAGRPLALVLAACLAVNSASCAGGGPGASGPAGTGQTGGAAGAVAWQLGESPGRVSDAVSAGTLLVAVGMASSSADGDTAGAWTSPDGLVWARATVLDASGSMTAVAAGPGRLVAVGTAFAGTSGPAAWTSADGLVWQQLPAAAFAASPGRQPSALEDVVYGPAGFVAVGSEVGAGGSRAAAWHSADGLAWTAASTSLDGDSARSVVAFGAGYVAGGWAPGPEGADRALFWTSADGLTWSAAPDADGLHGLGSPALAANGSGLVAVTGPSHAFFASEAVVLTSRDGASWQRQGSGTLVAPPVPGAPAPPTPLGIGLYLGGVLGAGESFVAAGEARLMMPASASGPEVGRKVVWTSPTGAAWTIAADLPAADGPAADLAMVGPVAVHRGRLVVFGRPRGPAAPLWAADIEEVLAHGG